MLENIERKIENIIEEALRLDTPEKVAKFKRRALRDKNQSDGLRKMGEVAKGASASLGGLGAGAGAIASLGGALPMSAAGAANPLAHAALMGTAGGLGGAALGAGLGALPFLGAAGYKYSKHKLKENEVNKRIVESLKKD